MSDGTTSKETPDFPAGCGFLSAGDIQAALEGRISPERKLEFEAHIERGCSDCVTLAADLETFRRLLAGGPLDTERREEEKLAEPLRARLRMEIRKRKLTSS